MNNIILQAKAPAKLILIGEFAVLEGAPSLVLAIDRCAVSTIKPNYDNNYIVTSSILPNQIIRYTIDNQLNFSIITKTKKLDPNKLHNFFSIFKEVYKELLELDIRIPYTHIDIDTNDFYCSETFTKFGLGSSAAVTVSLYGGLYAYSHLAKKANFQLNNLFCRSFEIHHDLQGKTGSGIDIAASVYGGLIQYQIQTISSPSTACVEKFQFPSKLYLLPVWTGRSASTVDIVSCINKNKLIHKKAYSKIIEEMSELSAISCRLIYDDCINDFLQVIKRYYSLLINLGNLCDTPIVSETHKLIADHVHNTNSSVYKPSGAGYGDFGIIYSTSKNELDELKDFLIINKFSPMCLCVSDIGFNFITEGS